MRIVLRRSIWAAIGCATLALAVVSGGSFFSFHHVFAASSSVQLRQLSSDPYTNSSSQHQTEVEPDTYAFGSTLVTTFQAGRFYSGGSTNIGWATSTDQGTTWRHGFLSGITVYAGGMYNRASDPSVAYDAAH